MSLKKKIAFGFLISASIIVVLVIFGYASFIEIRKEIRFLELSDTIRSKSLQLRRHEKNFFLYKDTREAETVHGYLSELGEILGRNNLADRLGKLPSLNDMIEEYGRRFKRIEILVQDFQKRFGGLKITHSQYENFFPLIESTVLERPLVNAEILRSAFVLPSDDPIVRILRELDGEINALRKTGEDILVVSKDIDAMARERAERHISSLQTMTFILFPLFFTVGLLAQFAIIQSIVKRLRMLTLAIEKTGKGDFSSLSIPQEQDEIGMLMNSFNKMEHDLMERDKELTRKNEELLRSRKLVSIGILASGVAHELNNPLNNIHISAQIMEKELGENCPLPVREIISDIIGQTRRMKQIVGDLLEFSRGRDPKLRRVEMTELVKGAYKLVSAASDTVNIHFIIDLEPPDLTVDVDPEQMERVFINLFENAVDAMSGTGDLSVRARKEGDTIRTVISDTGRGMPPDKVEKIFEPFYTTRDRGTGLGLAIIFNIIRKHGGDITVASEVGRGTAFTITLPVRGHGA
jgi:two-component system NtrC family sensor kinase